MKKLLIGIMFISISLSGCSLFEPQNNFFQTLNNITESESSLINFEYNLSLFNKNNSLPRDVIINNKEKQTKYSFIGQDIFTDEKYSYSNVGDGWIKTKAKFDKYDLANTIPNLRGNYKLTERSANMFASLANQKENSDDLVGKKLKDIIIENEDQTYSFQGLDNLVIEVQNDTIIFINNESSLLKLKQISLQATSETFIIPQEAQEAKVVEKKIPFVSFDKDGNYKFFKLPFSDFFD